MSWKKGLNVLSRVGILVFVLILTACSAHHRHCYCYCCCYCPELLTIQMVEKRWGTPNEVISTHRYTWYGYVTKIQSNYPVKKNFSALAPRTPIAIPVPVAHTNPRNSSSKYGCSVWYKADKHGVIISSQREGDYCQTSDFVTTVGT